MPAREDVDEDMARELLGLIEGNALPSQDELMQTARSIILTNVALDRELSPKGLLISPIWENRDGASVVRLSALPSQFRSRYYEGAAADALQRSGVIENAVSLV